MDEFEAMRKDPQKFTALMGAQTFSEALENSDSVHPNLKEALELNNFVYPSPIQQQVIDEGILEGQSMIITAESGSGKTLSYLLPVIN